MDQTMAEYLEEKGAARGLVQGKQEALLSIIREKFSVVPEDVEKQVKATTDEARLDAWIKEAVRADKLAGISFDPNP